MSKVYSDWMAGVAPILDCFVRVSALSARVNDAAAAVVVVLFDIAVFFIAPTLTIFNACVVEFRNTDEASRVGKFNSRRS